MSLKSIAMPGLVALAITALWIGLRPMGAGPPGAADDAAERARAVVEKTCAGCHPGPALDAFVSRRLAQGRDALDAFLAGHHVPDAALRSDVIAHLEARIAAGS